MAKMTVSEGQATDLLVAVGLVIAPKWDAARKQKQLSLFANMTGIEEKVAGIADETLKRLGEKTLKACAAKVNILVAPDTPAENPEDEGEEDEPVETTEKKPKLKTPLLKMEKSGKPTKPVKPDVKAKAKPEAKEKKEKKEAAAKDPWGTREGTRTARINAVLLTGKPYTSKEIEEKANARAIHSHLSKLVGAGKIERTADGKYQMKGPKPDKVKKVKK